MIVDRLVEADEVDPKAYAMSLVRKREIVRALVKQHAVSHKWHDSDRLLITYPKSIPFENLLRNLGVPPSHNVKISQGAKNRRTIFVWEIGALEKLIFPRQSYTMPEL